MKTPVHASSQHHARNLFWPFVLSSVAICLSLLALSAEALTLTGVQSHKTHAGAGAQNLLIDRTKLRGFIGANVDSHTIRTCGTQHVRCWRTNGCKSAHSRVTRR